ncbi:ATP-dependent endonuclease [Cupriavidus sp. SK-3]|uniref:UvrD-helicase domain-containing protein n=1 Tax=Cupriavidus sp. SK-3 TaxID=1470558 RepID=UPI000450473F|nr:UvrD-helicase domain-containing protein [Cupriavidus sp. SK-3]KDP87800.1 ATP-dependent endonuclease [Cupriavidus sp. SK-3]
MNTTAIPLNDNHARRAAMADHGRSLLVEAGAGSGKTAVMAGRIAMMLAEGIAPRHIAAVTFTELAASELVIRVREFVAELTEGRIPAELSAALPDGLHAHHQGNLHAASARIDEITCSTIHGFCQRLIKPYPVEANIDPGAGIMDRDQGALAFADIIDGWLREQLDGAQAGLIAELVLHDPDGTVKLVHRIVAELRNHRNATVRPAHPLAPLVSAFRRGAAELSAFMDESEIQEAETMEIAGLFAAMAQALDFRLDEAHPADLARLLMTRPDPALCKATGEFKGFRRKGKWADAARDAGRPRAEGELRFAAAGLLYQACCEAWEELEVQAATRVLAGLVAAVQPVIERFNDYKRSAALLDFDDLIFAARDLLRDHEPVRQALAARYRHVLVDEFQDTDPLQAEIVWRLCGEPASADARDDWTRFTIRPGALFLVGDPKQAIYRFRGADVAAYVQARDAFATLDAGSVLPIATNFRSRAPILQFVNERFEAILRADGQPGFTALDPFHNADDAQRCVVALHVEVKAEGDKVTAENQRDAEAEAVADMCARMIGSHPTADRKSGAQRPCRPGDIALLAPTGSDLWRYEAALERRGIPVATQAGKGFFQRQEVQDLIAVTRVLADVRDTLALGALLRGPLVGLTEEQLLDIIWALPRPEHAPDTLPRLDINVDLTAIQHPLARDVIAKLQAVRRKANATTPYDLLSQAIDMLRMRPILQDRHRGQAERALANVDLYLNLARAYAVRGLRAFAETMTAAWTDASRASEGRPDAQEEAVALYTMHAAKGLEWPIVVPINTMTQVVAADTAVTERATGHLYCPVFGIKPAGYEVARNAEKAELERERIRLWYVAVTRARELLVLPRLDVPVRDSAWISLLDLSLSQLDALDLEGLEPGIGAAAATTANHQTHDSFGKEALNIVLQRRHLNWLAPSRDEGANGPLMQEEVPEILIASVDGEAGPSALFPVVQGGRERGLIIHKLLEEVLTGETDDAVEALAARAAELIPMLGEDAHEDAAVGLSAAEMAGCVARTLALPEIAALRPTLVPELPVYASTDKVTTEEATVGIADAASFAHDGTPQVIIDWKSDVNPDPATLEHYRAQVRSYLGMTGAARGLIVLVTPGLVIPVTPWSGASQPACH